jgi:hypothetical protein
MAEPNAAEVEQQAEASFAGGFKGTPPTEVAKVVPDPKVDATAAPKPAAKPQYVRVTQQEWDNQKAMLGKVSSLESQIAKLTGSVPKADAIIQQVLEKVQAATPAGVSVEFSDEDFAELAADFPELAKSTRAGLERIFKKANVRGNGAPAVDDDTVEKAVERSLVKKELAGLVETHPTWKEIVGAVDTTKGEVPPADNPFRHWLAAQSADYQKKIDETQSPAVVQSAIDLFMASTKAPSGAPRPDRAATRRAAIEDAVTPRFDGSAPPLVQNKSADEAFAESFEKTRRK